MKVFVSWSGGLSKAFATEVVWWLRSILFPVEPWMSDSDISPGDRSLAEIEAGLNGAKFGILCVTAENQTAPWLNFEAGAISKEVDGETGKVVPLLIDMLRPTELTQSTLSQFQAVVADKAGFDKLAHAVNDAMGDNRRSVEQLNNALETYWPQLDQRISSLPKGTAPTRPRRQVQDMVEEVLQIVRKLQRSEDSARFLSSDAYVAQERATVRVPEFSQLHPNAIDEISGVVSHALAEVGHGGKLINFGISESDSEVRVKVRTEHPLPEEVARFLERRVLSSFPHVGRVEIQPRSHSSVTDNFDR